MNQMNYASPVGGGKAGGECEDRMWRQENRGSDI